MKVAKALAAALLIVLSVACALLAVLLHAAHTLSLIHISTDKEFKILRIKNPAQRELVSVLNVQPDITKDRVVLVLSLIHI